MDSLQPNSPCFFTQQIFLIGTYNENGTENFAPISWISYTRGEPSCLVISINGTKRTKSNLEQTGLLSASIVTPEMLPLIEQFNRTTYQRELLHSLHYETERGHSLNVPLLKNTQFSYECQVIETVLIGTTHTYFAEIKAINASDDVKGLDFFDLRKINPVIYSPANYFTVGDHLGKIGDFSK